MNTNVITFIFIIICACNSGNLEKNIEYQPFSKSVLAITFDAKPADTVYLEARAVNNVPKQGSGSDNIPVENQGTYFLTLVNDRPSAATLSLDDENYNVIIYPQDTTYLTVRSNKSSIDFQGRGKVINEYYQDKKQKLGYTDLRYPLNKEVQFARSFLERGKITDSLINIELNFLQDYLSIQRLPNWFVQYEEAEIKYLGMGYKTALPKLNETFNYFKDTLPEQYYAFIQLEDIDNPSAIGSSRYWWFLDDYFMRDLPLSEFNSLSGHKKINKIQSHILKNSRTALTGKVKDIYHQYLLSSLIKRISDTSMIDSLARVYEVQDYEQFYSIAGSNMALT